MGAMADTFLLRPEWPADRAAVRVLNLTAFEGGPEAALVEALHDAGAATLALVAELGGEVAGHILFSPVAIGTGPTAWSALGLAPMAVLPRLQRQGIGAALVHAGLATARAGGHEVVFVLGHPAYYPRFGFLPAHPLGLRDEYGAPDDAFLVLELVPRALRDRRGLVRYRPEFGAV